MTGEEVQTISERAERMRDTEQSLLLAIYRRDRDETVRDICNQVGNFKQNCYYLDKWTRKGWYNYGVSMDLGWLTGAGESAARRARASVRRYSHDREGLPGDPGASGGGDAGAVDTNNSG